ncbi:MAG: UDP-N-acetylmuramoyl-tripeptide--D-alanyl-D-alanine ligase [Gammaproteobacteria bacterium]|nr:UDP-N-acetylmuramoyl-tripeptide--D-alanyl-D-alanine ligase [Gammaproteobacteria bacterium]
MLLSNTRDISKVLGIDLVGSKNSIFKGVCTDTRKDVNGKLFVALVGNNYDAHDYIEQAYENGAVAAIVSKKVSTKMPLLVVKSTENALSTIAKWHLKNINPIVVAITGSNGKTTTKNLLASILNIKKPTHATKGNLNNNLGVPITILGLDSKHKYAVIEMGANHINEIKHLREMVNPDIAIVTNTLDAHIGEFGGLKNLITAKGEIYSSNSQNIVNKNTNFRGDISFGNGGDIFATNITKNSFDLNIHDKKTQVVLKLIGKHNIENALAASACAHALGVDINTIKQGLEDTSAESGRLTIIKNKKLTIIDDTYNASPQSIKAAIKTLLDFEGSKVAVLGSMAELGSESIKFHNEIGEFAKQKIDTVYSYGDLAINYNASHFDSLNKLAKHIIDNHKGSTVMIKGSRMVRLNDLVELLQK